MALGVKAVHTVARAKPKVALDIDPQAIEQPDTGAGQQLTGALHRAAVGRQRVAAHIARAIGAVRHPGVDHVQEFFVGRKSQAVGLFHVINHNADLPALRIDAVNL